MTLNGCVEMMNRISIESLENMTSAPNTLRLYIEDGKITGFSNRDNGKLYKEIPTQTANPSGDEQPDKAIAMPNYMRLFGKCQEKRRFYHGI